MRRFRGTFALVLVVAATLAVGLAVTASRGASPASQHDHLDHDHTPATYEEIVQYYNPNNSPNVEVVDNGDGTFTITFRHPAE